LRSFPFPPPFDFGGLRCMHRSRKKSEKSSQSSPSVKIILFDLNFIFTDEGVESHRIEWHGINAPVTSRARAIHFSRRRGGCVHASHYQVPPPISSLGYLLPQLNSIPRLHATALDGLYPMIQVEILCSGSAITDWSERQYVEPHHRPTCGAVVRPQFT
jgi:hypothetical protein